MCNLQKNKTIEISKLPKLWLIANAFKAHFENITVNIIKTAGSITYQDDFSVCATCAFFACELYLKFIYACDKRKSSSKETNIEIPEGHNLHTLFYKLNGKTQKAILQQLVLEGGCPDDNELRSTLKQIGNGFNEWRYLFEARKNMNLQEGFLHCFLNVLKEYSTEIINRNDFGDSDDVEVSMHATVTNPSLIDQIINEES